MAQKPDDIERTEDGGELLRQARICRAQGSPFTAAVLEAARETLDRAPGVAALFAGWQGDRGHAALALRLAGGLHALARKRFTPRLAMLYRERDGAMTDVIGEALALGDAFLLDWMQGPPKTNEVTRAGAIMAALLVVAERFAMPMELLELGSSAGLNLNLHRYAYDLGGVHAGDVVSRVRIAPEWRGPPPPDAPVRIAGAAGVDLEPLDLSDEATVERLLAYVWADRHDRMERLAQAVAIWRTHRPDLVAGDAADWLEERLQRPQPAETARVVFHSIVLQYVPPAGRQRIAAALEQAGARATDQRPLAHVSFEWDDARSVVQLALRVWPGGEARLIGRCHAHAEWIDWSG